MRILVTGSREWTDHDTLRNALFAYLSEANPQAELSDITLVHGGARGADTLADQLADRFGWATETHLANWKTYGKAAGHRRNAEMVSLGADVCLAFPIGESRGTRGCIAMARQAGIPVVIYEGGESA